MAPRPAILRRGGDRQLAGEASLQSSIDRFPSRTPPANRPASRMDRVRGQQPSSIRTGKREPIKGAAWIGQGACGPFPLAPTTQYRSLRTPSRLQTSAARSTRGSSLPGAPRSGRLA